MKELKKEVRRYLKIFSKSVITYDFCDYKYKSDEIVFIINNSQIGFLDYTFVSSKFAEFGAEFGMNVSVRFGPEFDGKCDLVEVIEKLNLTYEGRALLPNSYFGLSSLSLKDNLFFNRGTVSFYEKSKTTTYKETNMEVLCLEIVKKVNQLFIPVIRRFVLSKFELIEDILKTPQHFSHPTAYIIILCYMNDKKELIDEFVERARQKKLFDSKSKYVDEVISKISYVLN